MNLRFWLIGLAGAVCAIGSDTACSLVSAAEATAALGANVSAGVSTSARSGSICRYGAPWPWEPVDSARTGFPRATFFIAVSVEHARENFDAWKDGALQSPGATARNIEGLGDRAVFIYLSDLSVELLVLRGDRLIRLELVGRPCEDSRRYLSDLARRILT